MAERLLLVEDRENLRDLLARKLGARFEVDTAGDAEAAFVLLARHDFAVVVSDVRLPGAPGTEVLAAAKRRPHPPEVVLMTAHGAIPDAVAALKAGAYDYLAKPFEPDDLLRVVERAAEKYALLARTRALEAALESQESGLLGISAAMIEVRRLIERTAAHPVPVLLRGESGTGKEVAARELHRLFAPDAPFVAINCGAIPENLLESELFGVRKGAFTGANEDRPGLFETANGGTLFLDEVAELPLLLQVKLNRALDEGEIRRVGDTVSRRVNPRIVAATHQDLEKMVGDGRFRADLMYRLKVVEVRLPALRQRPEDIPMFAARFLQLAAARFGTRAKRLSPDAVSMLERGAWPGNVRELRHAIEHAAVLSEGETIEVEDLPREHQSDVPSAAPGTYRDAIEKATELGGHEYLVQLMKSVTGNVTKAALEAGMERESLHRLLRRHQIDPAQFRRGAG